MIRLTKTIPGYRLTEQTHTYPPLELLRLCHELHFKGIPFERHGNQVSINLDQFTEPPTDLESSLKREARLAERSQPLPNPTTWGVFYMCLVTCGFADDEYLGFATSLPDHLRNAPLHGDRSSTLHNPIATWREGSAEGWYLDIFAHLNDANQTQTPVITGKFWTPDRAEEATIIANRLIALGKPVINY